jgi:hypothetical protein
VVQTKVVAEALVVIEKQKLVTMVVTQPVLQQHQQELHLQHKLTQSQLVVVALVVVTQIIIVVLIQYFQRSHLLEVEQAGVKLVL